MDWPIIVNIAQTVFVGVLINVLTALIINRFIPQQQDVETERQLVRLPHIRQNQPKQDWQIVLFYMTIFVLPFIAIVAISFSKYVIFAFFVSVYILTVLFFVSLRI